MGINGATFFTEFNESIDKLKDLRQTRLFQKLVITVRAKLDTYGANDESSNADPLSRVRYSAVRALEADFRDSNLNLVKIM